MSTIEQSRNAGLKKEASGPIGLTNAQLNSCIHCGLCLDACPTYRLAGDENNSPRGRLHLWKSVETGRLEMDALVGFYSDECVGCLACEPVCPANVPYRQMLERVRGAQVERGKRLPTSVTLAGRLVRHSRWFGRLLAPVRLMRRHGLLRHPLVFPGRPAVGESSAQYARRLMTEHRPDGPRVALFTGCLMDGLFREINFATIRVLVRHNVQVIVPAGQTCCGAFLEHTGLPGVAALAESNRRAFEDADVDAVLVNSAGCGLSLKHVLGGDRVQDVLGYLAGLDLAPAPRRAGTRVFVDLPCHLVHGQRETIPAAVLNATGPEWEMAPRADHCCGSGGVYNIVNPENADAILREKCAFLDERPEEEVIVATANHVCMMQWHSGRRFVHRPYRVAHVIQLLDEAPCQAQHASPAH